MREKIWKYDYDYEVDPDKNIDFKYLNKSDILKFDSKDFISIEGSEFTLNDLSSVPFKKYRLKEPIVDGTGPVFFNPKYGVLSIGNVIGPTIIFLPKKAELKMAKEIFEKTTE
ncbi:hypothetical protein [Aquimarina litoralis]|uniref:hypothetical protein n=1 Tax=Aquimarina litoralis TaxID=584605 RepID=UPI001C5A2B18|nr:hypothetical protein [Aquimarina litoralis]MBW1296352.1 hypothetical protein [Aquimarina litoralis]